jgi:hypothetical protein
MFGTPGGIVSGSAYAVRTSLALLGTANTYGVGVLRERCSLVEPTPPWFVARRSGIRLLTKAAAGTTHGNMYGETKLVREFQGVPFKIADPDLVKQNLRPPGPKANRLWLETAPLEEQIYITWMVALPMRPSWRANLSSSCSTPARLFGAGLAIRITGLRISRKPSIRAV